MITMKATKNLAGVCIRGDLNDFHNLEEGLHAVMGAKQMDENFQYAALSTRLLALCYEIRHAYQGDRDIVLEDNGLNLGTMKSHSLIGPTKNIYYECNYLFPEMFFVTLAINELVELRAKELSKNGYREKAMLDKNVLWDEKIALLRLFQGAFVASVKEFLEPNRYVRWLNIIGARQYNFFSMACQYIDIVNLDYLKMSKEKRRQKFNTITKRISKFDYDEEHNAIKNTIQKAAQRYQCTEEEIALANTEYPQQILW